MIGVGVVSQQYELDHVGGTISGAAPEVGKGVTRTW